MTNLEAIQADVNYPLPANSFKKALLDRGLNDMDEYDPENFKPFELATADAIYKMCTSPNVTEGGYSLSVTEKKELMDFASSLYKKHGEDDPSTPTISSISPW